ncbi:ribosome maturation factor RimP [Jonesiaceae bacterium BS-20]|uniref:Ribosome maturation factor RimP n=1 Tax=Jonesiaceae bacterium BS-20 TaxID=3120821 RepID=A0AAU7DZ62_9MICO
MTTSSSPQLLEESLRPVVEQAGLFLEEVSITKAGKSSVVRVLIDLPGTTRGSVTLDQVAEATQLISAALDEVKWLASAYTLEVSSPGATRPLETERHFARATGRLIRVTLTDGTKFTERLVAVNDSTLTFEQGREVALETVRQAQVEVELKRLEEVQDEDFDDQAQLASDLEDEG